MIIVTFMLPLFSQIPGFFDDFEDGSLDTYQVENEIPQFMEKNISWHVVERVPFFVS